MASAETAIPAVQSDLVMEGKASRLQTRSSFSKFFASMKLSSVVPERDEVIQIKAVVTETSPTKSASSPLGLAPSASGTFASDCSTIVSPDDDDKDGKQLVDEATAFIDANEKIPDSLPALPKPILIPRLMKGHMAPLARAWPPEAAHHAIEQEDFITFIDNLTILSKAPPISAILQLAAFGISFIPWDGADGVSALTELSAVIIGHVIVARRCKRFLDKTNANYFHPRQLHARLIGTKAMRKKLGIPKDDPLLAPLCEDTLDMTAHERCLAGMVAYSCELSHEVPQSSSQTKVLERLVAWKHRVGVNSFDKKIKRARKRTWKKHLKGKHLEGKRLKREGYHERCRIKQLQWLWIQNLDEFEREEAERAEQAEAKKLKRGFTWKSQMSTSSNEEHVKD